MKITTEGDSAPATTTMKVAGDQVRMEVGDLMQIMSRQSGGMAGMSEAMSMMGGAFSLTQGVKMTVVMPSMNMAMTMDMGAMFGGGPGAMVELKDPQMTVEDLGAGERILGYATRKYRVNQKFTTVTNVAGQSRTEPVDQTLELWMATDVGDAAAALTAIERVFTPMQGASAALKEFADKRPPGIGVRMVMPMPMPDGSKKKMTTELAEIKKASFEVAEFTVPAGMQTMDLGAMMSGRGRGGQ